MEEIVLQILTYSLALSALYALWASLNWAYFRPKRLEAFLRQQGLRGNKYSSIHGDLKELKLITESAKAKPIRLDDDIKPRVLGLIVKTIAAYGNESYFWIGPKPSVILTDPEMVKEVLRKNDVFTKPVNPNPLTRILSKGLIGYEGEKWAKHRKLLNPAFHMEKLKLMVPAFGLSSAEVLNEWEKKTMSSSSENGGSEEIEIDVWPYLQTITSDAISRTAFGSRYEDGRKIFQLQNEQVKLAVESRTLPYIPGSRYLPTRKNKRLTEIKRDLQLLVRELIDRRMKAMKSGEEADAAAANDLLGLMLESNFREVEHHGNNSSYGMSIEEIIDECTLFYLAGQETTSSLILWTMVLLSRHPEWQERAREEVLNVFGKEEQPNFEGLNHLKVVSISVTMILHEVMRFHPPVAALGRHVSEEIRLGSITLPAGASVSLPILHQHHSAEVWGDDAMEFNPERFREGVAKAQKGRSGLYFPFGWGPRICIGQSFALLETKVVVSMILQRFKFRLSPSYAHAPHSLITIQPQHGAPLILQKL
ncbi:hypothetical protein M569_03891 [Genlisea aurea]|uniref:Cytochrome P450 n=1 Tax=Genlisea aurea TaxID=192259 RepID=S8CVN8_9LAMI|nr:hypothetical protein M569_03891 [Genlisea aurea]